MSHKINMPEMPNKQSSCHPSSDSTKYTTRHSSAIVTLEQLYHRLLLSPFVFIAHPAIAVLIMSSSLDVTTKNEE
jgi:hypothetical protein